MTWTVCKFKGIHGGGLCEFADRRGNGPFCEFAGEFIEDLDACPRNDGEEAA